MPKASPGRLQHTLSYTCRRVRAFVSGCARTRPPSAPAMMMMQPPHLERNATSGTLPTECESNNSSRRASRKDLVPSEHPFLPPIAHVVVPTTTAPQPATVLWPPPSSSTPAQQQRLCRCLAHCYLLTTLCQVVGALLVTRTHTWQAVVVWILQQQEPWLLLFVVVVSLTLCDLIPTMLLLWRASSSSSSHGPAQRRPTSEEPSCLAHAVLIDATAMDDEGLALRTTLESLAAANHSSTSSAAESSPCIVVLLLDSSSSTAPPEYCSAFRDVLRVSHHHEALPALERYLQEGGSCCSPVLDPYHVLLTILPAGGARCLPHYWDTLVATYRSLPDGRQFLYETPTNGGGPPVVALTLGFAQSLQLLRSNPWTTTTTTSNRRVGVHAQAVTGTGSPLVVPLPTACCVVVAAVTAGDPWTVAVASAHEQYYTTVAEVLQWYPHLPLCLWWRLLRRVLIPATSTPRWWLLVVICLVLLQSSSSSSSTVLCGTAALLFSYSVAYTWGKALLWERWLLLRQQGGTPRPTMTTTLVLLPLLLAPLAAGWVMLREASSSRCEEDAVQRRRRPVKKAI